VNNDPVNWLDLWGLNGSDVRSSNRLQPQVPYDPKDYHCDIYAYNAALAMGLNPKGQDGTVWNGNELKVAQIYDQHYPNNRTSTPIPGTSGYVFMNFKDGVPLHMELYDYPGDGNTYSKYKTDGIKPPEWTPEDLGTGNKVFVPLTGSRNGNIQVLKGSDYEI